MTDSARIVAERAGWSISDVDRFVGHQANKRILDTVADLLSIPTDRVLMNIESVGNTAAASIPLALTDAAAHGQITAGDRTVLAAFGGGATWAATALTWPDIDVPTAPTP